jgi:hypothetical protein
MDKTSEQKALKSLDSILHDVEDIMIEEAANENSQQAAAQLIPQMELKPSNNQDQMPISQPVNVPKKDSGP